MHALVEEMTPLLVLKAYALGVFPMARSREEEEMLWVDPDMRGIIPLESFHIPHKLRKTLRKNVFSVRIDYDFDAVINACAEPKEKREDTWINKPIKKIYTELYKMGCAHSIECWKDGKLAGGLYGLALGSAFFGESMFTRVTDASKVALCHLVAHLRASGFTLLDTQFLTTHLAHFGAVEITRDEYLALLETAMSKHVEFIKEPVCFIKNLWEST